MFCVRWQRLSVEFRVGRVSDLSAGRHRGAYIIVATIRTASSSRDRADAVFVGSKLHAAGINN
jgi:hypothetical protein